jgi:hypothetical protein
MSAVTAAVLETGKKWLRFSRRFLYALLLSNVEAQTRRA